MILLNPLKSNIIWRYECVFVLIDFFFLKCFDLVYRLCFIILFFFFFFFFFFLWEYIKLETIIQCNANLERRLQNLNDFMEREMNEKQIIQKLEHQILVEQKQFDNEIKSLEQQQMQLRKNLQMDMEYKIQDTRQSLIAISEEKMLGPTKGTIMESEQMRYELAYQSRESKKMESFMKEKECYQKKMIVSNVESEKKERCCALRIHEYKQSTKTIDSLINEKSKENEDQVAAITNNHAENEKESTNELTNDDHHFINYHQSLVKLLKVKKSNLYLSQTPLLQLLYSTCHEILKPYFKPIIQSQKDDTEIHKKMNIEDTIAKMDNETNTQTKLDTLSNTKKKELCDLILIKLYKNSMKKHSNITLHPSSSAFVALKTFLDCDNNLFCIDRKC